MNENGAASEYMHIDEESGETVRDVHGEIAAGLKFIDELPNGTVVDKAWNKKDLQKRVENGENLNELKEKYVFYDDLRKLIDDTLMNVPEEQRKKILPVIEAVIEEETNGEGREQKKQKLEFIRELVVEHKENQLLARYKVAFGTMNPTKQQILGILEEKSRKEFVKTYEKFYTPELWNKIRSVSPMMLSSFSGVFLFNKESDLLQEMTLQELSAFTAKVESALQDDCMALMDSFLSPDEKKAFAKTIKKVPESEKKKDGTIVALMKMSEKIAETKKKNMHAALLQMDEMEQEMHTGYAADAVKMLDAWEEKYGANSLVYLSQRGLAQKIREKYVVVETLKASVAAQGDLEIKKKMLLRLYSLESVTEHETALQAVGVDIDAVKIDAQHAKGLEAVKGEDLDAAIGILNFLIGKSDPRAAELRIKIGQKKEEIEAREKEDDTEKGPEDSNEKILKKRFLEATIEHVLRVKDACSTLGIPTNDPAFWGEDGVKNRKEWLEKNGLLNMYYSFDTADKNRPKSYGSYVTFRWVDVKTAGKLTASGAESGIRHMKRMEESGPIIAALGAAFSFDYSAGEKKCYDPDEYLDRLKSQLANV